MYILVEGRKFINASLCTGHGSMAWLYKLSCSMRLLSASISGLFIDL